MNFVFAEAGGDISDILEGKHLLETGFPHEPWAVYELEEVQENQLWVEYSSILNCVLMSLEPKASRLVAREPFQDTVHWNSALPVGFYTNGRNLSGRTGGAGDFFPESTTTSRFLFFRKGDHWVYIVAAIGSFIHDVVLLIALIVLQGDAGLSYKARWIMRVEVLFSALFRILVFWHLSKVSERVSSPQRVMRVLCSPLLGFFAFAGAIGMNKSTWFWRIPGWYRMIMAVAYSVMDLEGTFANEGLGKASVITGFLFGAMGSLNLFNFANELLRRLDDSPAFVMGVSIAYLHVVMVHISLLQQGGNVWLFVIANFGCFLEIFYFAFLGVELKHIFVASSYVKRLQVCCDSRKILPGTAFACALKGGLEGEEQNLYRTWICHADGTGGWYDPSHLLSGPSEGWIIKTQWVAWVDVDKIQPRAEIRADDGTNLQRPEARKRTFHEVYLRASSETPTHTGGNVRLRAGSEMSSLIHSGTPNPLRFDSNEPGSIRGHAADNGVLPIH